MNLNSSSTSEIDVACVSFWLLKSIFGEYINRHQEVDISIIAPRNWFPMWPMRNFLNQEKGAQFERHIVYFGQLLPNWFQFEYYRSNFECDDSSYKENKLSKS